MSRVLTAFSALIGLLFLGFGANAVVNPVPALDFFQVAAPTTEEGKLILAVLSPVYGVRDIFMGVSILAAAGFGSPRALGTIMIAGSLVAGVDGAVCKWVVGSGEMQHWGYAPTLALAGIPLLFSRGQSAPVKTKSG